MYVHPHWYGNTYIVELRDIVVVCLRGFSSSSQDGSCLAGGAVVVVEEVLVLAGVVGVGRVSPCALLLWPDRVLSTSSWVVVVAVAQVLAAVGAER